MRLPAIIALLAAALPSPAEEAKLLRFPTVHGNTVVFGSAGNLYSVPVTGGVARRLTSHEGYEMFPRFSPDGKWLAFTGQYDGNTEVFVMPATGGVPKRLTYTPTLSRDDIGDRMGPNNIVIGWKNDSRHILFRSRMRSFNDFIGQLFVVSVEGDLPQTLPLPRGGFGSFSDDDSQLVYNRIFREFRTWKRYRGGMTDDLSVYDFKTKESKVIAASPAAEIIPMWHGRKVYFLSDRDSSMRMNLYVFNFEDQSTRQLTKFTDFDVKFPSHGDSGVVFENGGDIYFLDYKTEQARRIPVTVADDRATARGGLRNVAKEMAGGSVSPDGKRAAFVAHGEVFSVPAEKGPTRNLTRTSGVHERDATWSPDGKWIAVVSDASGESEIHILPADGKGPGKQVTKTGAPYKYAVVWSPDSKKLLYSDRAQKLHVADVATGEVKTIASATAFEIRSYVWSPDSNWVAYAKPEEEGMPRVYLHSLVTGQSTPVTDSWYSSGSPSFSDDGKYLFFTSARDFNPTYSQTEWNHSFSDMQRVYFVTLAQATPSPFRPQSDEVTIVAEEKPADPKPDSKKDAKPEPLKVDLDGLIGRTLGLPIRPANYRNIAAVGGVVYYIRTGTRDAGPALQSFDLNSRKETSLGAVDGFEVSANRKKMLVKQGPRFGIIDLPKGPVTLNEGLDVSGMEMTLDRQAEWKQIYNECWRLMRDYFYDPNLHGVDWAGIRAKYEPLIAHVSHRSDLNYVIGEMIGEINAGHAYVGGTDALNSATRTPLGLLGAELSRDAASKFIRIDRILPGANWDKKLRSPLTELGVDAKVGQYIVAINGIATNSLSSPYAALVNTVDKQVSLSLNSEPKLEGAREVTVVPIGDESALYYHDWVQENIRKVDQATGGKCGYIHVPDMGPAGLVEFVKHFGPQLRKKALIIDVRGNGGGNISPMLIERLRREMMMVGITRNGTPRPEPSDQIVGPKVCLLNEFSASDGDLFPWRFRQMKLGPLVGKRSWGGVIGIRNAQPLIDGGSLNVPEFSRYDLGGKEWIIEGKGVEPDIVVENDPAREYAGIDEQLNRGVAIILEKLKTEEKSLPAVPPYPKR
ncbi:MAG: PDZ domain-containing protein [Gemmataceae bacterium]|nr:PDZ domain-containing protein [Gemmataceae bacterium]